LDVLEKKWTVGSLGSGVFTGAEEKKEGDDQHVSNGLGSRREYWRRSGLL
jgi:hypothetical protein